MTAGAVFETLKNRAVDVIAVRIDKCEGNRNQTEAI